MAKKDIVKFDLDFPEIEGHSPYEQPTKQLSMLDGYNEVKIIEGRRPSELLLVERMRAAVDQWRLAGWPGASETTQRLFNWWFEEAGDGFGSFRPYWGQREALETLAYLVEVAAATDARKLIEGFAGKSGFRFEKPVKGGFRQVVLPDMTDHIDLPPSDLGRFAFKMATGSGKTLVMAMAIVWSYFHARREPQSAMSDNFLVIAPNVIVFERLRVDFENAKVFRELNLLPPEWSLDLRINLRGDSTEPGGSGNLFVTNIQQLYDRADATNGSGNPVQKMLGRKPPGNADTSGRPLLERVREMDKLLVLNDEAHHVHDEDLMWNKTLQALHSDLPGGLSLWLDFSATPKFQNGAYFPWVVCDYPLAQAVEDGIVKTPTIMHLVEGDDPGAITGANVLEKYEDWLVAGVGRLKEHEKAFKEIPETKPVMFVMCESIQHADKVGEWLRSKTGGKLKDHEVLVIHTDKQGEIKKGDLDELRKAAREIDDPKNHVRVVVSVMVLREGWDVRNVTIVLGLRPGTSSAKILPEQTVGRGLRLMKAIGPDYRQILEVLGTPAFENFVRELESEGVIVPTKVKPPKAPVTIQPVEERKKYDIAIPQTGPILKRVYKKIDTFDPLGVEPVATAKDLKHQKDTIKLEVEEALSKKKLGKVDVDRPEAPFSGELVSAIVGRVEEKAHLTNAFAQLAPLVRTYLVERCFGTSVDIDDEAVRRYLADYGHQVAIAERLAYQLGKLVTVPQELKVETDPIKLSESQPFLWRRETCDCTKTVFNLVATYNPYETRFGQFLDRCKDVVRFAALAEHFTKFHVEYLKPSGALGHYFPDWVAIQKTSDGPVNWIIETKGRVWPGTENKDAAVTEWCKKVSEATAEPWKYIRVNQIDFQKIGAGLTSFADMLEKLPNPDQPRLTLIQGGKEPENAIPLYSLEAAAGAFASGKAVEEEGWIEVDFPVKEGMFAARVVGRSMEPEVPDGCCAVFVPYGGGTRENKVVLAQSQSIGDPETGASYTVKRYTAVHGLDEDGREIRTSITLRSDNPEVESIELEPDDDVAVIAVLDYVLGKL